MWLPLTLDLGTAPTLAVCEPSATALEGAPLSLGIGRTTSQDRTPGICPGTSTLCGHSGQVCAHTTFTNALGSPWRPWAGESDAGWLGPQAQSWGAPQDQSRRSLACHRLEIKCKPRRSESRVCWRHGESRYGQRIFWKTQKGEKTGSHLCLGPEVLVEVWCTCPLSNPGIKDSVSHLCPGAGVLNESVVMETGHDNPPSFLRFIHCAGRLQRDH